MPDTFRTRRLQTGALTMAQILLIAALIGVVAVGALFLTGVLPQSEQIPATPPTIVPEPEPELVREEEIKPTPVNKEPMINIFYKDGQKLDNCLIANSARRAELRKMRKAEQANKEQANGSVGASGKGNSKR